MPNENDLPQQGPTFGDMEGASAPRVELPDASTSDPETAPADPDAQPLSQTLSEFMTEAGLDEQVTITEGLDDTPTDQDGRGLDGPPRDVSLWHPEEEREAFAGSYRLTDLLALWFGESVERWAQGEQIVWEIGVMAMPQPQQPGMFIPGLVVALSCKGVVMNTIIYNTVVEQPFGLSREVVDRWCQERIGELLQGRSQQLDEMNQQAQQAQQNGRTPPGGGLIIPGR